MQVKLHREKRREEMYPRKKTYWPVKLSTFPLRCSITNCGRIATASKYIENAQNICAHIYEVSFAADHQQQVGNDII